jgi:streptogramin lyase
LAWTTAASAFGEPNTDPTEASRSASEEPGAPTEALLSLESALVIPGSPGEAEQLQAQQEAKRVNPEAVMEREASRTEFETLNKHEAASVASEAFPAVITDPAGGPPVLPAGQNIRSYLTEDAAQVELGHGKEGVVESMQPMALETAPGQLLPVDLGLSAVGNAFEPTRPEVDVRIPKQLDEGVRLADTGVSVTPVSPQDDALSGSEGLVDGASVLYANTQTDADTVVKPTTFGFDADTVLRSVDSPTQLSFRVNLPPGARLVQGPDAQGPVEIVKEGTTLAVALAPSAQDAAGTNVPVSMSLAGDTLTLAVSAASDYQFPIEVDPEFIKGSDSQLVGPLNGKRSNWKFKTTSEAKFGHEPNEGVHKYEGEGKGYLETSGTAEYKETEYAFWSYQTKGVSRIYEFNAKTEGKNTGAQIESFLELEGTGSSENKYKLSTETFEPEYPSREAPPLCAKNSTTKVIECAPTAGTPGNLVRFQQSVQKKPTNFKFSDVLHEGTVYLSEPEGTHSTTKFNTTSKEVEGEIENSKKEKVFQRRTNGLYGSGTWLSNFQGAVEPIAEDPGIGVADTKLEYENTPGHWLQLAEHNYLTGNGCEGVQCYATHGEYLTLPEVLANGEDKIRYRSEEAFPGTESLATDTGSVATVKVDTAKPHNVALIGLPFGNELSESKYELTAQASDGEGSIPSSGVKSIVLFIDGKSVEDKEVKEKQTKEAGTKEGECSAPRGSCIATARYTVNGAELGAGHHSIQAVVLDNAGNEAKLPGEGTEISIRHSTPVSIGPGSVDLQSGGFSLSATDVNMGSGLTVSRAYGSRAVAAGEEGSLGPQWTVSLTGATSLVEILGGSVTMTAANGSQTIFAAILNAEGKQTGKFESPPGDSNLTLTVEENEAKEKLAYYLKNGTAQTSVKFTRPVGGGKAWLPTRQEGAVKTDTVTYSYRTAEVFSKKVTQPLEALGPVPAGVSCPAGALNRGCRALKFTYATSTTAGSLENEVEWGNYKGLLKEVLYEGYNPATKTVTATAVAKYLYDSKGRLRAVWDPRITPNLKTRYGYDAEGHVTGLSVPGHESWVFTYAPIAGDAGTGRLLKAAVAPATAPLWTGKIVANTEAPKIASETPVIGVPISVSHGTWSNNPVAYSYQWEDCTVLTKEQEEKKQKPKCALIPGATNASYKPVLTDAGFKLAAKVGALNGGGAVTIGTAESAMVKAPTEYSVSSAGRPAAVVAGPDGNLWFTYSGSVGKMTPSGTVTNYPLTSEGYSNAITAGPDGNMWFTRQGESKIGKITPAGTVTEYKLPAASRPFDITAGPNKENALWFTDFETGKIGKITTAGVITEWAIPGGGRAVNLTVGPEGNVWFTSFAKELLIGKSSQSKVGKITPAGVITEYEMPTFYPTAESIVTGPDGNLWVTSGCDEPCDIWKVSPSGKMTAYQKPIHATADGITVGPEGNLWFTTSQTLGRITTAGVITEGPLPAGSEATDLAVGPEGNLWLPFWSSEKLAKVVPSPIQSDPSPQPGWTMEYNVPLEGSAAPHQMGMNHELGLPEPERWGQTDDPVEATAIVAPDAPQGWPAASYKRATVYYLDGVGHAVNVAQPSTETVGAISTSEFNEENDVVRQLSPVNRATALKESCETRLKCRSAEVSHVLDSVNVYNEPNQYGEPAGCRKETAKPEKETAEPGTRLCETWGPQHMVKYIPNGFHEQHESLARNHMKYFYEDIAHGAPEKVEGKAEVYNLVTETTDLAELESGSEEEVESRKTTMSYSGQSGLGWTLRAPTSVVSATETGGAKLETKTLYYEKGEAKGQVKETRRPKGLAGASAHDEVIAYYTAEENTEGFSGCGNHPEWAGLICETLPAKQPAEVAGVPRLPITITTYNMWDEPEKVEETFEKTASVPTTTRTRTSLYDAAGRLKESEETSSATTESADKALPKVTDEYTSTTGLLEKQSTTVAGVTKTLTTKYNALGQLETYGDADGNTATYKYGGPEKDGLLEEMTDGSKESKEGKDVATYQRYHYNETTKGLTVLEDSGAGTFTASYNMEGQLASVLYPNSMCANYTHNAVGESTHVEYIKTANCSESAPTVWFSESSVPSIRGEVLSRASTLASETYTYDTVGRLLETQETPSGAYCKTRNYTYDEESNRTELVTREPNVKHECATEGGTVEKHTYDEANRLTDAGVEYDSLGNVRKLPAADAEQHELVTSFYVDDAAATQEQNGTRHEYFLDPNGRTRETVTSARHLVSHYDGTGQTVGWACEGVEEKCSASNTSRNIPGIDGTLTAVQSNGNAPVLQLHDLEGNIVGTAADNAIETKLLSTYNSTEFGVPNGEKAPPPFAWLGAADVASSFSTGVITYGATSYVPQTGMPLQGAKVEPPGAPSGSGMGAPYSGELTPWATLGAQREADEAPGIGATEEREAEQRAFEAALAAAHDPIHHYREWEAKEKGEKVLKLEAAGDLTDSLGTLFGTIADWADGYIEAHFTTAVAFDWLEEYGQFLEACVRELHGIHDAHGGCRAEYSEINIFGASLANFWSKPKISYCVTGKAEQGAIDGLALHNCTLLGYKGEYPTIVEA